MALLLLAAMATVVLGQVPPWLEERADQRVGHLPARTCLGYGVAFVELLRREACDLWSIKPELHAVEIFCGSQGVTKALRKKCLLPWATTVTRSTRRRTPRSLLARCMLWCCS